MADSPIKNDDSHHTTGRALAGLRLTWSKILDIPGNKILTSDSLQSLGASSQQATGIYTSLLSPPWAFKFYPITPFMTWTLGKHVEFIEGRIEKLQRDAKLTRVEYNNEEKIPLSYPQEQVWFQLQDSASPLIYNYSYALHFPGKINISAMEDNVNLLMSRHQGLRCTFHEEGGKIFMRISNFVKFKLRVVDYRGESSPFESCQKLLRMHFETPLNLETGPLVTYYLILINDNISVLHCVAHHIIADGTTAHFCEIELRKGYDLFCNGVHPSTVLPPVTTQYSDFVFWQRAIAESGGYSSFSKFWKKYLENLPPLDLSRDWPRIPSIGMSSASTRFKWSENLTTAVIKFAKKLRVTPFVILLSGVNIILGRYSRQNDVSILTAKHGRTNAKVRTIMGHFINTIVVRTQLKNGMSFLDLVQSTDICLTDIYENQEYPFQLVIQDLIKENGKLFQYLLFPVCVVMIPKVAKSQSPVELTSYIEVENNTLTHELSFYFEESEESLAGYVKYNPKIHSSVRIEQLVSNLETLLRNALNMPLTEIQDLDIVGSDNLEAILTMGAGKQVPVESDLSLITLFDRQVSKTPSSTAVVEGDLRLTYKGLNEESNILSRQLDNYLQHEDTFVAILLPQSAAYITSTIGILKSGRVVVPLSVQNSAKYLNDMLIDLSQPLLISSSAVMNNLTMIYPRTMLIDEVQPEITNVSGQRKPQPNAYCIHTSGSTGFPKPVLISHFSLINHSKWAQNELQLSERDSVLVFNNVSFDASLQDMWPFLLSGGKLCIPPPQLKYQIDQLWKVISTSDISCVTFPTAVANKIMGHDILTEEIASLTPLRVMMVGGESLHTWRSGLPFHVVNGFGLTECTIISTFVFLDPSNWPCSGTPIWNTNIYIVDENMKCAPVGVPGEICVAGAGVSRYWNREELQTQKFIPCPFQSQQGLLCRTGDVGYWRFDENLCVVGRMDSQIKVRGHRVELGEIEAVLVSFENISESVVVLDGDSLSAFCKLDKNCSEAPEFHALQKFLQQKLPYYGIPSKIFTFSANLPLNANGKVDKTLLDTRNMTFLTPEFIPVIDSEEALISNIWADVLGLPVDSIGRETNFFSLGGHSLLVADVVCRLQEEPYFATGAVSFQVEDLFKEPTVAGFTKLIKTKLELAGNESITGKALPPITFSPSNVNSAAALSYQQEQIWFHIQENSNCPALYNETFSIDLKSSFNSAALISAIQIILDRHKIMKSNYTEINGETVFIVNPDSQPVFNKIIDLRRLGLSKYCQELISREVLHTTHRRPFNLQKDLLIRFTVLHLASSVTRLQVIFHHLIMDAIGILIFERELKYLYKVSDESGPTQILPPLQFQYADFAVWQRESFNVHFADKFTAASAFWKNFLADLVPVDIFPHKRNHGRTIRTESKSTGFKLSSTLTKKVKSFSVEKKTTAFVTLLSALKLLIYRYSGQEDIFAVCTTSGRTAVRALDSLIGYFVNMVIFRNVVSNASSFEELVRHVHYNQSKVLEHQDYPFQNVIRDTGLKMGSDLYRLSVTMEPRQVNSSSFFFEQIDYHTKFELTVCFDECKDNYAIYFVYNSEVFKEIDIEGFGRHFQVVLENALESGTRPINNLDLMSMAEQRVVIHDFNMKRNLSDCFGQDEEMNLIQLFFEQAEKTPNSVAIVEGEQQLTYAELAQRITLLAGILMSKFTENNFVAVLLPQCTDFVISSLSIISAGKICVPLSVEHPRVQLEYMLKQVENPILISKNVILQQCGLLSYANALLVDDAQPVAEEFSLTCDFDDVKFSSCAYCFFTSGSTGQPKAVLVEHDGIINCVQWLQDEYTIESGDRNLLFCSPAFDFSLSELWPFILTGASVFIPPNDTRYDVLQLNGWLTQNQLTFSFLTTRIAEEFVRVESNSSALKWIITGGESLHAHPPLAIPYCVANCYGNTETSIISTAGNLVPGARGIPNVGYGIRNVKIYVLDSNTLSPFPIGIPGEIFVGGVGVTPGYLNDDLTAEKIIPDPNGDPGAKMYKSGDLGYWVSAGELVIIGRRDNQMKIRGIRIGLGQIEDAMLKYPCISQAVVAADSDSDELIAYCIGARPTLKEIKYFLREQLPLYAIPSTIVFLTKFPLTATGKVDKNRLQITASKDSTLCSHSDSENRLPVTLNEELIVAKVWAEIIRLPVEEISPDDNFFSLGGHSLLVGAVIARLQSAPWFIKLQIGDLFKFQTVSSFAQVVKAKLEEQTSAGVESCMTMTSGHSKSKLSFQQEQIWFHMQDLLRHPSESLYNETFSLYLTKVDVRLLQRAIKLVSNRHSILRVNFVEEKEGTYQVIKDRALQQNFPLQIVNLRRVRNPAMRETISRNLLTTSQSRSFHLVSGYLIRFRLISMGWNMNRLQAIFHHLIMDAVAILIFEREFRSFYDILQGRNFHSKLVEPTQYQYSDFATWQREYFLSEEVKFEKSKEFWRDYLSGLEPVKLFPRPRHILNAEESQSGTAGRILSPELTKSLKDFCCCQNTTPFVVLLATFKLIIYRYTKQSDLFTVCSTDGRNQAKLDTMIGYFINMLIFRNDLSSSPSFSTLVNRVQQSTSLVLEHQDYPFQHIMAATALNVDEVELYNLGVTMEPRNHRSTMNDSTFFFERIEPATKFDLLVGFDENTSDGIQVGFLYNRNVYMDAAMERMNFHFESILKYYLANASDSIDNFNFLSDQETSIVIQTFNMSSTQTSFPENSTLSELFMNRATDPTMAKKVAIQTIDGNGITYAELLKYVLNLKNIISESESRFVCILLPQGAELIIATLAIQCAGRICSPLSIEYPRKLLESMFEEIGNPLVVTTSGVLEKLRLEYTNILLLDLHKLEQKEPVPKSFQRETRKEYSKCAYCIFTSGSTGKPKAVLVEHSGIINCLTYLQVEYGFNCNDRSVLLCCPAFDLSLAEMWPFLFCGATLCVPPDDLRYNVTGLHTWVHENNISIIQLTTKLGEEFFNVPTNPDTYSPPRWMFLGGEALCAQPSQPSPYQIIYGYGNTETSIITTLIQLVPKLQGVPSIGYPIGNVKVYMLDSNSLNLMPIGAVGEICIGGIGVTPGYLNREEQTAEKIVPNPYAGARTQMYKSGDLGYWLPTGELTIVGRRDNQVKIRGIRIGLGQIQEALHEFPEINQALVVLDEEARKLTAFCVGRNNRTPQLSSLFNFLSSRLPRNAIPSEYVFVSSFPLTLIGKVDKKALLEKRCSADSKIIKSDQVPPSTVEEKLLAQLWSEVLCFSVNSISVEDNFFALGGHSLLVTELVQKLQSPPWNYQAKVSDVFSEPNLAKFAANVLQREQRDQFVANSQIIPQKLEYKTAFPLSYSQEQIWLHSQTQQSGSLYTVSFQIEFSGHLINISALQKSLNFVFSRHQILQSTIHEINGNLHQKIHPPSEFLPLVIRYINLSKLDSCNSDPPTDLQKRLCQTIFRANCLERSFKLDKGPLIRLNLLKYSNFNYVVLGCCHHCIMDGLSVQIFKTEVKKYYEILRQGGLASDINYANPQTIQYSDFVLWQRENSSLSVESITFWRSYLESITPLELRTDKPRSEVNRKHKSAFFKSTLDSELSESIRKFSRDYKITGFTTILALIKLLLFKYTNQSELFLVSTTDGRTHPQLQNLIGHFINMVIIRTRDLTSKLTFEELALSVSRSVTSVRAHQDVALQNVISEVGLNTTEIGLFRFGVTMTRSDENFESMDGMSEFQLDSKYELFISINEAKNFEFVILYDLDLYTGERIQRFASHFEVLVNGIFGQEGSPSTAIHDLNMLNPNERDKVLYSFNSYKSSMPGIPKHSTLSDIFEEQVQNSPEKLAIITDDAGITYKELNQRVNAFNNFLLQKSKCGDAFVAILLPQSPELIVSSLAILKSGKTCVPLNVDSPNVLINGVLKEVGYPILITTTEIMEYRSLTYSRAICIESDDIQELITSALGSPEIRSDPNPIAYCFSTSGSTGEPKVTMTSNSGVVNVASHLCEYYRMTSADRSLMYSSPAFDMSLLEIWSVLPSGGAICIPPAEYRYDLSRLRVWTDKIGVTVSFLTTKIAEKFILRDNEIGCITSMRALQFGGEAFNYSIPILPTLSYGTIIMYGVTESSIYSTASYLTTDSLPLPIVGKPIVNVQVYILSEESLMPLPIEVTGEIIIRGVGTGPGYLNRPELNKEKFIPDTIGRTNDKMYRTGDLGYWHSSGELVFVGRKDDQIKIRGIRINLGLIEKSLQEYPGITQGVVLVEPPGDELTAYFQGSEPQFVPSLNEVTDFLRKLIPQFAIPKMFFKLPKIPLNTMGKVDRAALRAMKFLPDSEQLKTAVKPPNTTEEKLVARAWSEILNLQLEIINCEDNFFSLGGHSLQAAEIIQKLRVSPWSFEVKVADIFQYPVLSEFARILPSKQVSYEASDSESKSSIKPRPETQQMEYFPLSYAQEQVWMHMQDNQDFSLYNVAFSVDFADHVIQIDVLKESINYIIKRHAILRTTIHECCGIPSQRLHSPEEIEYLPKELDLQGLAAESRCSKCITIALDELRIPFDLSQGPLIRFKILKLSDRAVKLLIFSHHCLMDGTSIEIFVKELKTCYEVLRTSADIPSKYLAELPIQYKDYVIWQREALGKSGIRQESQIFWKEYLTGLVPLEFPTDCPRNSALTGSGTVEFDVSNSMRTLIKDFSKAKHTTSFVSLFSVLIVLIYRYTKQTDIFLISPTNGRTQPEIQNLLGHFVNLVLFRVENINNGLFFCDVVRVVHESYTKVYSHMDSPLQSVLAQTGIPVKNIGLYRLALAMSNSRDLDFANNNRNADYLENVSGAGPKCELGVFIAELADTFRFALSYAEPIYKRERMQRLTGHFQTLLDQTMRLGMEVSNSTIGQLQIMTGAERKEILYSFNTDNTLHNFHCYEDSILALFESQCIGKPGNMVYFDEPTGTVTYSELNKMAINVASKVREEFIASRNTFIVVLLPASKDALVGIITVLKLNGTCVPINIRTPPEQIRSMMDDIGNPIVITNRSVVGSLGISFDKLSLILLDDFQKISLPISTYSTIMQPRNTIPFSLFTSGSTGKPKAVLVTQNSILNLIYWMQTEFKISENDSMLEFYSPATDAFMVATWPLLTCGGAIFVPPDEMNYNVDKLWDWVAEKRITFVGLPTASAEKFYSIQKDSSNENRIKCLLCGGEPLKVPPPPQLPYRVINCYGLTESGVISTFAYVNSEAISDSQGGRIVIGKPIRNNFVYIVDDNLELLPIGVTGELCIGGDGIAQGYFKNDHLNRVRFVQNPFSSQSQVLFRTGDLGYWMPDGNICLTGRSDNLVKIRSNRVELDEVEISFLRYKKIKQAAVLMEENQNGEKIISAYCVANEQPVYNELYGILEARLPYYALPSEVYVLPSLPLNNSGKIDRKLLPSLKTTSRLLTPYGGIENPPQSNEEMAVAQIWAKVLGVPLERIGRADNFFLLGGNSLLLAEIIAEYNRRYNTMSDLTVSAIFSNPTVETLAKHLEDLNNGKILEERQITNFSNEIDLNIEINSNLGTTGMAIILLTGATGYLGSGILVELLNRTSSLIYCLIRASNIERAREKLNTALVPYKLENTLLERAICVLGDLTEPRLGINDAEYDRLTTEVGAIYHCGAEVHFLKSYLELRRSNVDAVKEVLKFATTSTLKFVHYISTLSVFSCRLYDSDKNISNITEIPLSNVNIDPLSYTSGYAQSKWVAEMLVWAAIAKGVPAIVYRPGEIGCHKELDHYNSSDMMSIILRTSSQVGFLPSLEGIVPYGSLDFCCNAIVNISLRLGENINKVFHVVSSTINLPHVFEQFQNYSQVPIIPFSSWEIKFKEFLAQSSKLTTTDAVLRGHKAVLSLMLSSTSFTLPLETYEAQTIDFSQTTLALLNDNGLDNLIDNNAIERHIKLILGHPL